MTAYRRNAYVAPEPPAPRKKKRKRVDWKDVWFFLCLGVWASWVTFVIASMAILLLRDCLG